MPKYEPRPVDTSRVKLSDELSALTERLAENTHDLWAAQRLAEGWTFGPERNDSEQRHPGLVPYRDLPEAEKQYDRITSMQTLRAILALGFEIRPAR